MVACEYQRKTPRESASVATQQTKLLPQKVRKGKLSFKLVDEDDEDRQETIPHEEGGTAQFKRNNDSGTVRKQIRQLAWKWLGKGKAVVTEKTYMLKTPHDSTSRSLFQTEDDTSEKLWYMNPSSTSDSRKNWKCCLIQNLVLPKVTSSSTMDDEFIATSPTQKGVLKPEAHNWANMSSWSKPESHSGSMDADARIRKLKTSKRPTRSKHDSDDDEEMMMMKALQLDQNRAVYKEKSDLILAALGSAKTPPKDG
ncbi:hypothetical protein Tco_0127935 [Tanacetum coccineum]